VKTNAVIKRYSNSPKERKEIEKGNKNQMEQISMR
jgi:hypothetical protein